MTDLSVRRSVVATALPVGVCLAVALLAALALFGIRAATTPHPASARIAAGAPAKAAPTPEPPPLTYVPVTSQEASALNAATPFSSEKLIAAQSFKIKFAGETDAPRALQCLTQAIYYEAAFEPLQGRRAVAQVVLNRLRNPIFPKTVCGVVYQGSEKPTGCQFTFTCDGALARPTEPHAWAEAEAVARAALAGAVEPSVGLATHYHANYVVPYWKPTLVKLAQIGAHIFYRWPDGLGSPRAFLGAYAGGEPATAPAAPLAPTTAAIVADLKAISAPTTPDAPPPTPAVFVAPPPHVIHLVAATATTAATPDVAPAPPPAILTAVKSEPDWFADMFAERQRRAAARQQHPASAPAAKPAPAAPHGEVADASTSTPGG